MLKYKHIEAAREVRLWIGQVIVPLAGVVVTTMSIPEVRQAAAAKATEVKLNIENRINKKKFRKVNEAN